MRRLDLRPRGAKSLGHIIVDLTPVLPGGENGGSKLLATQLVWQFSRNVAPECEYVLLTSSDTHEELSWLDAGNVRRLCLNERQPSQPAIQIPSSSPNQEEEIPSEEPPSGPTNVARDDREENPALPEPARGLSWRAAVHSFGQALERALPRPVYNRIYQFYRSYLKAPHTRDMIGSLDADLIFCPYTAPLYQRPGVPMVIVVHDLQYQTYPQFFKEEDLYYTDHYFRRSCQLAARLICVSEYTRQMVLASSSTPPERVVTIQSSLFNRLETLPPGLIQQVLEEYRLDIDGYLLYPANFWHHKNHEMLLTAFSMYLACHPGAALKLVLTGAPGERMIYLKQAAHEMGLGEKVLFPGFVPAQEYSALLQGCLALIFPSLYEGFGAPVIEAMAFGKPVLSSNLTSLPEVTQSAAHLFDPRKPDEITAAIERIHDDVEYRTELIARGRQRLAQMKDPVEWARAYFDVFRQVVGDAQIYENAIQGLHPDHWAGETVEIAVVAGDEPRHLELSLSIPPWLPGPFISVRVEGQLGLSKRYRFSRGTTSTMQVPLRQESDYIKVSFSPTVRPVDLGLNADMRLLSCQVLTCRLVTPSQSEFIYKAVI